MDVNRQNPQFDCFLGGSQTVPSGLNLSEFIKHRMEEVIMLTEAIEESPFRGQAFQRLPKHMRRRQMSHYIKRLPRRLQRLYLMSLKDGPPAPTKCPSRKYRRRPSNLLLEYNRRQKKSVWLETHIWHAKRFHMSTKWGYKLPEKSYNKSFKACYRAITEHCLLIDMSYYNCIELRGLKSKLLENLKKCTSPNCGLTFGAKMYLSGTREGSVTLFHPNSYPYDVIGNVTFIWEPGIGDNEETKIWIWVHPLMHSEVVECFKLLFNLSDVSEEPNEEKDVSEEPNEEKDVIVEEEYLKISKKWKKSDRRSKKKIEQIKLEPKNVPFVRTPKYSNKSESVTMTLLKDTLNRFQLTGPLSQAIVSQAFTVASIKTDSPEVAFLEVESKRRKIDVEIIEEIEKNWWEKPYKNERCIQNWFDQELYTKMSQCIKPSDMPPGMILGLVIEDPRLKIPSKREKAVPKIKEVVQMPMLSASHSQSPIWIPEVRDEVSMKKLTTQEINEARSKKIVPGFDVKDTIPDEKQSKIPILLIQRPGRNEPKMGKLGLGSGWDIIAPAGFGMPIWLSLIFRGARTGGLRESELLHLECNNLNGYLSPDSVAGELENQQNLQQLNTRYFKLPASKRANFTKLGVLSPFYPPWKVLIKDWIIRAEPKTEKLELSKIKFSVLRDSKLLLELSEIVNNFTKRSWDRSKLLSWGANCLVPVFIECCGKGKPKDMALICLPEDKDFKSSSNSGPVEPSHVDENEKWRKMLKSKHSKLLKSLKRKRKKERAKMKEKFANSFAGKMKWKDILKCDSASSKSHSKEYNIKMERLWLPDVQNIESVVNSCSRTVLGFIVKGEFSYSRSFGLGLGFVTFPGLVEVLGACRKNKSKVVVLIRNRNQVQYRFGRLKIGVSC